MVINLDMGEQKQILLLAPDLLGESLALKLTSDDKSINILLRNQKGSKAPALIIWAIENLETTKNVRNEIRKLHERWHPSPLLLLLPSKIRIKGRELLQFECAGILQDPDINILKETIQTLITGGRVIRLKDEIQSEGFIDIENENLLSLYLKSSIREIDSELSLLESISIKNKPNIIMSLTIKARSRELKAAKHLLLWIWSPFGTNFQNKNVYSINKKNYLKEDYGTNINIPLRTPQGVWESIYKSIKKDLQEGISNNTQEIFAFEAIKELKRKELLLSLLNQLDIVFKKLFENSEDSQPFIKEWLSMQLEIRTNALRDISGDYERLSRLGEIRPIADELIKNTELIVQDEELPPPNIMLDTLIKDMPFLVDGQLLPSDDPRALIKLETLIKNWIIRTSEIISAEIIDLCASWPELRSFILNKELISTRELERLRNQLNSQSRIYNLFKRPIHLYESKRLIYSLKRGNLISSLVTEPRDDELRNLGWWQKQVAFLIEARDALAPQVQSLVKYIGDLMVLILTNVLGRAIGLVGKGIAQGMGRTISR